MPGCICNECTNYGDLDACLSPLNVTFPTITATTIGVSWTGSANPLSYVVEFRVAGTLPWSVLPNVVAPTTVDTITGLTPETEYEIRVNAVCDGANCYSLVHIVETLEL